MKTINEETLSDLKELMDDDFEELIKSFVDDISEKTLQIKDLIDKEDTVNLRSKAHSLKGSSKNIGAELMAHICSQIESSAKDDDISNIDPVYIELEKEAMVVKNYLNNLDF